MTSALVLLLAGSALTAFASLGQRHRGQPGPPRGQRAQGRKANRGRAPHRHPPGFFKRLRDLSPEEQERVLANDERFQHLPPERQAEIRDRLRQWNALSPEEKDRIRERQEIFSNLSPSQREKARALFQEWQQLDPVRRQELRAAFRQLRDLPPAERKKFLSSAEISQQFSRKERHLLSGLSQLLPEGATDPSADTEDEP